MRFLLYIVAHSRTVIARGRNLPLARRCGICAIGIAFRLVPSRCPRSRGARFVLFLPFNDLGLIIVEEEHDPGFKQDDRIYYQARHMAVVRGRLGGSPVILASATPSVESHVNARTGRYRHVVLRARYSGAELPDISAIDLRKSPPDKGNWLSPILAEAVAETLAARQQTLLFLNRRGYEPLTLCRSCGHRMECCPYCRQEISTLAFAKQRPRRRIGEDALGLP